jgi:hypothetical protein
MGEMCGEIFFFILGAIVGMMFAFSIAGGTHEQSMIKANCGCYDTKTGAFKTGEDCK